MSGAHGARWRRRAHAAGYPRTRSAMLAAMSGGRTVIDRARLASLDRARARALPRAHAALARARRGGADGADLRRADALDGQVGGRLSALLRRGARRPHRRRRRHEYVDFALGDTGSMPGHSPEPTRARGRPAHRRARRRDDDDAHRGLDLGRRRAAPALRPAVLAVRAHRDGRESLRPAHRAPDPAPAPGARLQLVLPRLGRRDGRDHRRRTARRCRSPATSGRRSIPPRRPSSSSSTTSRACAARSRAATSPAS